MSHVITGIICFFCGAFFGLGWMALLSAGKQSDEAMLQQEDFPDG